MSKSNWIEVESGRLVNLSDVSSVTTFINGEESVLTFINLNGERVLSVDGDSEKIVAAYKRVRSQLGLAKKESAYTALADLFGPVVRVLGKFTEGEEDRSEWADVYEALLKAMWHVDEETLALSMGELECFCKRRKALSRLAEEGGD